MRTLLTALLALLLAIPAQAADFTEVVKPEAVFEAGYIQVLGESGAGQARHAAILAARATAQVRMLEIVKGVQVSGARTVGDGFTKEVIVTKVQGVLKGAVFVESDYDEARGVATVALRMAVRGDDSLYSSLGPVIKDDPKALSIDPKPGYSGTATAVVRPGQQPRDGVIVDVRGLNFKPALVNRILADNGELVFGPSEVVAQALVDRGCGGYVTTEAKARGLLELWGSKNPLVVKAQSIADATDIVVGAGDAAAIHAGNAKNGFLAQARVVFILQ